MRGIIDVRESKIPAAFQRQVRFHLSKTFGQPPQEFLTNIRLRRAAQLLSTGDLPVKIIADKIGYQSRSSFSRAFKASYGTDPAYYRKQALVTN